MNNQLLNKISYLMAKQIKESEQKQGMMLKPVFCYSKSATTNRDMFVISNQEVFKEEAHKISEQNLKVFIQKFSDYIDNPSNEPSLFFPNSQFINIKSLITTMEKEQVSLPVVRKVLLSMIRFDSNSDNRSNVVSSINKFFRPTFNSKKDINSRLNFYLKTIIESYSFESSTLGFRSEHDQIFAILSSQCLLEEKDSQLAFNMLKTCGYINENGEFKNAPYYTEKFIKESLPPSCWNAFYKTKKNASETSHELFINEDSILRKISINQAAITEKHPLLQFDIVALTEHFIGNLTMHSNLLQSNSFFLRNIKKESLFDIVFKQNKSDEDATPLIKAIFVAALPVYEHYLTSNDTKNKEINSSTSVFLGNDFKNIINFSKAKLELNYQPNIKKEKRNKI